MVNRRSFFKSLTLIAPSLFLPKLIVPTFKQTLKYGRDPWITITEGMPFTDRDFSGKWQFVLDSIVMDNRPILYPNMTQAEIEKWNDEWHNDLLSGID